MEHAWWILCDLLFNSIASHYDIGEHSLHELANEVAIPRILAQCGLRTHCTSSRKEANADADDASQHGVIQLPCRSVLLRLLSYGQLSHCT